MEIRRPRRAISTATPTTCCRGMASWLQQLSPRV